MSTALNGDPGQGEVSELGCIGCMITITVEEMQQDGEAPGGQKSVLEIVR